MSLAAAVLSLAFTPQMPTPTGELEVGRPIEAVLAAGDDAVSVADLRPAIAGQVTAIGHGYVLRPAQPGWYTLDLEALAFDAYLVVRDAEGRVVAEDDNSWMQTDARALLQATAGAAYEVWVLSHRRGTGGYRLQAVAGRTPPTNDLDARIDRARRGIALHATAGVETNDLAEAYAWLAASLRRAGRPAEALEHYTRVVEMRQRLFDDDDLEVGIALGNLGTCLDDLGEYERACATHLRALEIHEAHLAPEHRRIAICLNNLACVLVNAGRADEAVDLHLRALAIKQQIYGERGPELVLNLNNLGRALIALSRYDQALARLEEARTIAGAGLPGTYLALLATMNNMAICLRAEGRHEEALELYRQALAATEKSVGADHSYTAMAATNLANLLGTLGRWPEAESVQRRALQVHEKRFGAGHRRTLIARATLAQILDATGRHDEAEAILVAVLASFDSFIEHRSLEPLRVVDDLAGIRLRSGRASEALELCQRARAVREAVLGAGHPRADAELETHVRALEALGRRDAALTLSERCVAGRRQLLSTQLEVLSEGEQLRWALRHQTSLHDLLRLAADQPPHTPQVYAEVLAWKHLVARGLYRQREWLRRRTDPDVLRRLQRLQKVLASIAASFHDEARRPADGPDSMAALTRECRELERQFGRDSSRHATATSPAMIAAGLAADEALIDYFAYRAQPDDRALRLCAFVQRRDAVPLRFELGAVAAVGQLVALHGQITSRQMPGVVASPPSPAARSVSARLRAAVWDPLAGALRDARRVTICPDETLATLAFGTLPGAGDERYLIEDFEFAYVGTADDLLPASVDAAAARGVLVVGGVDYGGGPSGGEFGALAETGGEADAIAALWTQTFGGSDDVARLSGTDAGGARVRAAISGRRFVHLATHGIFTGSPAAAVETTWESGRSAEPVDLARELAALASGVVFAGANDAGTADSILTAAELAWLDLRGCELATLSACDTALGTPVAGEGLLGLRRALRLAGAQATLTSLWKVEDRAARQLMLAFYRRLWRDGNDKVTALRAAKLEMLQAARASGHAAGAPGAWGAFVLDGR